MNCSQPGSVHGDSPGKNTEIGCHALLQGIFPTQGSNPLLPHSGFFTSWAARELHINASVQFRSVAQSCPTLCDPMNYSTPGLLVHHQLPEFTQTHIHRVSDTIQPSHPLSSPFPSAPNPSQHQSLFPGVNSSHEVAKVLEFITFNKKIKDSYSNKQLQKNFNKPLLIITQDNISLS